MIGPKLLSVLAMTVSVGAAMVHLTAFVEATDPSLYSDLRWRHIGPFRGGRTVGAAGVAQQPNVFYIGVNNGGVWKTTDFGQTCTPIFDDQPTQSIGAVAVASSDPNINLCRERRGTAASGPIGRRRHLQVH